MPIGTPERGLIIDEIRATKQALERGNMRKADAEERIKRLEEMLKWPSNDYSLGYRII